MKQVLGPISFALPEQPFAGIVGVLGLFEFSVVDGEGSHFCYFSPTHSPNPSLAPPGERGGLHLAACLKVGNRVHHRALASKWPQHIDGLCKSISAQRQQALKCLQPIEKPRSQFDGNVPMRAFFPPLLTRPNEAVSSPFRPGGGGEGLGERGGVQRLKNKNAADNRFGSSIGEPPRAQKILQKQEHIRHIERGLALKETQRISQYPQTVIKELTA